MTVEEKEDVVRRFNQGTTAQIQDICKHGHIRSAAFLEEYLRTVQENCPNDYRIPSVVMIETVVQCLFNHMVMSDTDCARHRPSIEGDSDEDNLDPFHNFYNMKDVTSIFYKHAAAVLNTSEKTLNIAQLNRLFNALCLFGMDSDSKSQLIAHNVKLYPASWQKNLLKKRRRIVFTDVWLSMTKQTLDDNLLKRVLYVLADHVLPHVNTPEFFSDFAMSSFRRGDPFDVLALDSIVFLVTQHNIDMPDLYTLVYGMIHVRLGYSPYRQRFFRTLNLFLSSSHISANICASFVKRLSRISLLVPIDCIMPLQKLIRNVLIRYPAIHALVNRDFQGTMADPFNNDESDPANTNALESSLWEIRSLQSHWHPDVASHSLMVEKALPSIECAVRWRRLDQLWTLEMDKPLTHDAGDFDAAGMAPSKKKQKFTRNRREQKASVAVTFNKPMQLFSNS